MAEIIKLNVENEEKKKVPVALRGIHWNAFLNEDGEKILVLTKIEQNGTDWQEKFSIKNLLNDDYTVTQQTLEREKEIFREPIKF